MIIPKIIQEIKFIYITPNKWNIKLNTPAKHQAITNWNNAMPSAHFCPNSLRIYDNAATQGVYNKQKINRQNPA